MKKITFVDTGNSSAWLEGTSNAAGTTQATLDAMLSKIADLQNKVQTTGSALTAAKNSLASDNTYLARFSSCGTGGAHGKYTRDGADCSSANGDDVYAAAQVRNRDQQSVNDLTSLLATQTSQLNSAQSDYNKAVANAVKTNPDIISATAAGQAALIAATQSADTKKKLTIAAVSIVVLLVIGFVVMKIKNK